MVAYNFKPRFVEPILAETKGGTIRAARKARSPRFIGDSPDAGGHAKPGEQLQLYTGMRTRLCRLIAHQTCLAVEPILLNFHRDAIYFPGRGTMLEQPERLDVIARFDGFDSWSDLAAFFRGAHGVWLNEFDGLHIRWLPLPDLAAELAREDTE